MVSKTKSKSVDKKYTWDSTLYYKSDKDPQIERDTRAIERAFESIEKKYKNRDFTSTPEKLLKALKDAERVSEITDGAKPVSYLHLRAALDSNNKYVAALRNKLEQRLALAENRITFVSLAIGKIPTQKQKQFLKDKRLVRYRYMLERIFLRAKHSLTEGEEQYENLLAQPSLHMWKTGHANVLSRKTLVFKGETIPVTKALAILTAQPEKDRRYLSGEINRIYKKMAEFSEPELNAILTFKKIVDERRKYSKPYSGTVVWYENDEETVEALVKTITKHFSIPHRFYKLHAKLLGKKKIKNEDKSVKIGEIKRKFDYPSAVEITRKAFAKVGPKYAQILMNYVNNRHIDVYPRYGKKGGAFEAGPGLEPVFILLNHADNMRSVETLAHEVGHGIHTELARSQPVHYRDYTIAVAEVASTFFEQVMIGDLEGSLSEEERVIMLHSKIQNDIATIFRQIACFNFEHEMHMQLRKAGGISKEELAALMRKHMTAYMGPAVDMSLDDGYIFVGWPHIRNFFYTYTYALGQLISRAMFENWKKDSSYIKKVEQFLKAGKSASLKDIFKSIGIDVTDPKFFTTGLKAIERDIAKLEKLTARRKFKVK